MGRNGAVWGSCLGVGCGTFRLHLSEADFSENKLTGWLKKQVELKEYGMVNRDVCGLEGVQEKEIRSSHCILVGKRYTPAKYKMHLDELINSVSSESSRICWSQ